MARYAYEPLFEYIRPCVEQSLTQLGHTLGQSIAYTTVELGMMPPHRDHDPIWQTLNFIALYAVALENRIEGAPEREIDQWCAEDVRKYCANGVAAAAALETEPDRQAFLHDLARVRAALNIE